MPPLLPPHASDGRLSFSSATNGFGKKRLSTGFQSGILQGRGEADATIATED